MDNKGESSNAPEDCPPRLRRDYKSLEKDPLTNPRVYVVPLETNFLEWHFVFEGPSFSFYKGGFYWGKLVFSPDYPFDPPSVILYTPNGRFAVNTELGTGVKGFHAGMMSCLTFASFSIILSVRCLLTFL
jgi:ubiquitin-conjugating enzyme E2 J2